MSEFAAGGTPRIVAAAGATLLVASPIRRARRPSGRPATELSYRRGPDAGLPFVRPFSQAPAVAPARKVTTKLSIAKLFISKKRSGEEKVPAPWTYRLQVAGRRSAGPTTATTPSHMMRELGVAGIGFVGY